MAFSRKTSPVVCLLLVFVLAGCGAATPRFGSIDARSTSDELSGFASYYAEEFHGRATASGEPYNMHDLTAAHRTLPFNSRIRVRNLDNGREVIVRINDRGPFKQGRVVDLSLEAAKHIGLIPTGTARVQLEVIADPSPTN